MKIIPKKSLGQNFLIDTGIIEKICNSGNITENNKVLEVGPGTGNLTEIILQKKHNFCEFKSVYISRRLFQGSDLKFIFEKKNERKRITQELRYN